MKEKLIQELKRSGILIYGDFKLKNGASSNLYINIKKATGDPKILDLICEELLQIISNLNEKPSTIAASGYGGIPIATLLSHKSKIPLTMVREKIKNHGLTYQIEGYIPKRDDLVLIIDDVFSSGTSIRNTAKGLEKTGARIAGAIVCIKREENTLEIPLDYILTLEDFT